VKKSAGRERDCCEELQPPFYLFSRLYRPNCAVCKVLVLLLVLFPKRRPMRSISYFFCVLFSSLTIRHFPVFIVLCISYLSNVTVTD
jgi:hypothetical protein